MASFFARDCNSGPYCSRVLIYKFLASYLWLLYANLFPFVARDCYDVYSQNLPLPEIYHLSSIGTVECLQDGWTVVQHRGQYKNPQDLFDKNWSHYVDGFGKAGKQKYLFLINLNF